MSGIFGGGSPQAPAPQQVVTVNQAAQTQDYSDSIRKRRGALATIMSQNQNTTDGPMATASKLILGQ